MADISTFSPDGGTTEYNIKDAQARTNISDLYANIGLSTTPVPSYVAKNLPILKRNITDAFYNGTLRAEIVAGNFKNVRPGDYIVGSATGSTYYVAELDWMYGKGDQTGATYQAGAYGTHHLGLMLFKAVGITKLWAGWGDAGKTWRRGANELNTCPWNANTDVDPTDTDAAGVNNTNISRTYNGGSKSAYLGSFIRDRLDNRLLDDCFKADFGNNNILVYRNWLTNAIDTSKPSGAYSGWSGASSGCEWSDRYLDLPSEVEIYGSRITSSSYFDIGMQCEQLSMFRQAAIHDFFPRMDVWTKGVSSSNFAAYRGSVAYVIAYNASYASWACPLACVK